MYNKNKEKVFAVIFLSLLLIIPQLSLASTISLRSSSSTIAPSKTFTLSIYVDPKATSSYTAQANINFPADLVSVSSFTFASNWFPITQSGYDLIDNTSGKLIKTAGYPNGFSQETLFGTVIFKTKSAGAIVISTDTASFVLDVDSNNTLSSYGSFSVTSSAPVVVPVTPPVVVVPKTPVTTTPKVVDNTKTTSKTTTTPTTVKINTSDVATITETPKEVIPSPAVSNDKSETGKISMFTGAIFVVISAYFSIH